MWWLGSDETSQYINFQVDRGLSPVTNFCCVVVVVQSLGEGELIAGSTLTLETWSIKHMVALRGCHPILMLLWQGCDWCGHGSCNWVWRRSWLAVVRITRASLIWEAIWPSHGVALEWPQFGAYVCISWYFAEFCSLIRGWPLDLQHFH